MKKISILVVIAIALVTMTSYTMVPEPAASPVVSELSIRQAVPITLDYVVSSDNSLSSKPVQEAEQPSPEPSNHRDDIVSDGNSLSYELQDIMDVPYALLLAIAETETHFDPDAVSPTNDYGLLQINKCNHEWLLGLGFDPLTHEGNIAAGAYIISSYLQKYGEAELSLMAYNCGPTGARNLWDAGVYQTDYSQKVMSAFEHWTNVLNNNYEED